MAIKKYIGPNRLSEIFSYIKAELDKKVTAVSGKGLSSNDYTTTEKNKLAGISSGAEVNVQADWDVDNTSSDAYILHKPTSMPASDVPSWAKQPNKPSYTFSDITNTPTTIAGYGITDAKIASGTITLGSNSITPLTQHQTVSNKGATLAWSSAVTVATIGGTDIKVSLPANPNTNTTYTFADGTNGFTVTPSGGTAQTVKVTPSITNNVTGSGTSGYLAKFNGANTITSGPQLGSGTTTYLRNDGSWATPTDTKNTAGSTDTSSKIFLIGATSQGTNPQTYSHDTAYVGTDGCLYSGGAKVLTSHQDISGKADKATTLAGYGITDAKIANGTITLGSNTITPLTQHQDVSGKADKSATVSTVTWSSNKLTKTINGNTTDVVTAATILGNLTKAQVTTALGYTPPTTDTNTTYTIATGDSNGQIKVTPSSGSAYNVSVKGLGSSAYTTEDSISPYEANLRWGGKNFTGSYGPIDAALMDELGANRFQFIKASAITVEYSRDGGSTWTDYGATDAQKQQIFAQGGALAIGKNDSSNKATANGGKYKLRITIDTGAANVYSVLNKFVIYCSTNGSAGCYCQIQIALQSTPTTFIDHTSNISIGGWSGYNVINTGAFATYGNSPASQYGRVRFIFGDGTGGNTNYNGLNILQIKAFGGVGWGTPSTMAKSRHLYSYDENQNVTFPANLYMSAGSIITPKDDSKGIRPNTNNYGEVGDASYYFYKCYCTNYYGTTSYVTNWSRNNNIGSPSTSSAASGTGLVNFYNTCAAGGTQTKTTLSVDTSVTSNITVYLPKTSGNLALAATTLSGYGITDAKIANGTITLGSNTITPLTSITSSQVTTALGYTPYNSSNPNGYITSSGSCAYATTASKLGSSNVGSATQPIYLSAGTATACTYTLEKSVPSDAVFTDTNNKVTQTSTSSGYNYEILLSNTADDTTRTEGARKCSYLKYSPARGSLMEGPGTSATGDAAHAEGSNTSAKKNGSHAEGLETTADGYGAHAEGSYYEYRTKDTTYDYHNTASGEGSHAEGMGTIASGDGSHAEGCAAVYDSVVVVTASGLGSHAEGCGTTASGVSSHAEGSFCFASGGQSHAEGYYTVASNSASHAEGWFTIAASGNQHVEGKYNVSDSSNTYAHIIGGGTSESNRKNIITVDWSGQLTSAADLVFSSKPLRAVGSRQASATNPKDLLNELRFSSGCMGSYQQSSSYTKGNVTLSAGWYNYIWIPHRWGGINWTATGDNCNYGTCILCGMTMDAFAVLRLSGGDVGSVHKWY